MLTWMRILPGLLLHNSLNEAQAYTIQNFSKGLSLSQLSWCSEFWAQFQLVIPDLLWTARVFCCLVAKLTVHDSMDGSTSGFPVFHYILEFAQAHVHWVQQWCCLTISSSPTLFSFGFSLSQQEGFFPVSWLFVSSGQSIGASASVLPMNIDFF